MNMPNLPPLLAVLATFVVVPPAVLLAVAGLASLADRPLSERAMARGVEAATVVSLLATLCIIALMLTGRLAHGAISFGDWIHIGHSGPLPHYHFSFKLIFDRLSLPFVALALTLCGTISAFANRYMHREPGYNRFFVLYAMFMVGMVLTATAGTIETLFTGWEMVGLSSALLVGFFQERPAPVRNGLRVWVVYRFSDAALLLAAVVLHHMSGEGDFSRLLGVGLWPRGETSLSPDQVLLVGVLLVCAAAGKSALVPFSGWLPRAMEGPTPSSAVFYGALSVHLGAFLLLRTSSLLDASPTLSAVVLVLGLATAALASLAGRVQTDIKSALSFASLTQVGLIVAEIGLGWRYVPLVHLVGHACLRTLQFVRAPTLLQDYRSLENAIGSRLAHPGGAWLRVAPAGWRGWLYRFGLERGYLDSLLMDYVVWPFERTFRTCDRLERRSTDWLAGRPSRESDAVPAHAVEAETLA
jgi:NAD(P)H-quinone oxidoreductase subunit 5